MEPARPEAAIERLTQLFGFAQFDLAGTLSVADGRYLVRDEEGEQSVLVIEILTTAARPGRRRRRVRAVEADQAPPPLPLSRATVVRAGRPFETEEEAERWLDEATEAEDTLDVLVAEGIGLLNRALHAQAAASGEPSLQELTPERAAVVRIGYGSGEQVAAGGSSAIREVDVWASGASRRRRRAEELRPQERVAAVLGGKEKIDPCETLLLRARADLDAGRAREAALQLRIGLEALLATMRGVSSDHGHEEDLVALQGRRGEAGEAANAALLEERLEREHEDRVRELLEICERVLRRRRVLRGG